MKILKSDVENVKPILRNSIIQWLDICIVYRRYSELSIDTLGPLPEDECGMIYIDVILIVDKFSKFVGLYPAKSTSTLGFVKAFLS